MVNRNDESIRENWPILGKATLADIEALPHAGIVPSPRTLDYESATFRLIEWHHDAAHGWLRVPREYVPTALANAFSDCSYVDTEFYYLEEDCDAPRFVRWYGPALATLARVYDRDDGRGYYRFPEVNDGRESRIRRKARTGPGPQSRFRRTG